MRRIWTIFTLLLFTSVLFTEPAHAGLELFAIHSDHLGTPLVITDKDKQVVWRAIPKPFGEMEVEVEEITHHQRFPGQRFDIESRLHYNYFRDYDPGLGRYVQSDPIGLNGGMNSYSYAFQNPLLFTDPKGLYGGQMNRSRGRPDYNPQSGGQVGFWGCASGGCGAQPLPGQAGEFSAALVPTLVGGGLYICSKPGIQEPCDQDNDGIPDELDDDGFPDIVGISSFWIGSTVSQNDQWCIFLGPSVGSPVVIGEGVRAQ